MKKSKLEIHAEAKIDFYGQIEYLAEQNCSIETLHKFLDEIEAASNTIGQNPFTWPLARPSKTVRKFGPTKTFRYLIYYVVLEDGTPRIINTVYKVNVKENPCFSATRSVTITVVPDPEIIFLGRRRVGVSEGHLLKCLHRSA